MTVFLRWWSTRLPNQIPVRLVATRKMPAMMPVAITERVSRNTQNVTANQTVKFTTDTVNVLAIRCANTRCVP